MVGREASLLYNHQSSIKYEGCAPSRAGDADVVGVAINEPSSCSVHWILGNGQFSRGNEGISVKERDGATKCQ